MTDCWLRALPRASGRGFCRAFGSQSILRCLRRPGATPTIADGTPVEEAASPAASFFFDCRDNDGGGTVVMPVRGEFSIRLESVCKTDRDNARPKHNGKEQHARPVGMMCRRVARECCRQGSGARCNNPLKRSTSAPGRSRSKRTRDLDIRGGWSR
jgi:hypothetical protein